MAHFHSNEEENEEKGWKERGDGERRRRWKKQKESHSLSLYMYSICNTICPLDLSHQPTPREHWLLSVSWEQGNWYLLNSPEPIKAWFEHAIPHYTVSVFYPDAWHHSLVYSTSPRGKKCHGRLGQKKWAKYQSRHTHSFAHVVTGNTGLCHGRGVKGRSLYSFSSHSSFFSSFSVITQPQAAGPFWLDEPCCGSTNVMHANKRQEQEEEEAAVWAASFGAHHTSAASWVSMDTIATEW